MIILLVDFSASAMASVPASANLAAGTIVPALGPADALTILPIDDGSVQTPLQIVQVDLSDTSFASKLDGVAHAAQAGATRLRVFLDSLSPVIRSAVLRADTARRRFAAHTDILGAIQHVAAIYQPLARHSAGFLARLGATIRGDQLYVTKPVIVLSSDMLQEGRGVNFARSAPNSDRAIDELIIRLRKANELPNLSGVAVIVSGATGVTASQVEHVRTFWMRYFAAAHADLICYDYDARAAVASYLPSGDLSSPSRSDR
jgi:hypothetical protein